MKPLIRLPTVALARLAIPMMALSAIGAVQAQDQALENRWFKVELLIFSQVSASGVASEVWDPTPDLAYPNAFRFLTDPQTIETNFACYNAVGLVNEFGRQILTINPPTSDDEPTSKQKRQAETANQALIDQEVPPEAEPLPLTPTPFTRLASDEMEFRGKAAYMQRTGRYQTLFHESWVQPVKSAQDSVPIILDQSGDTREWPSLQGSVKLYLSRYLHIETNLWLNTPGQYLPAHWQIPDAPLGPRSLIIEYPESPEPLPKTVQMVREDTAELSTPIAIAPVYPWRHAVVLKQKRRMRSTEIHYIDHPMLGVVVLVSPLSEEELEAMAAAEFAPEGAIAEEAQTL